MWRHTWCHISSYVNFIKHVPIYLFQYEIPDWWNKLFKNYLRWFWKNSKNKISNGKNFPKKTCLLAVCELSPDFHADSGFYLPKDGRIKMRGILQYIGKKFVTPLPISISVCACVSGGVSFTEIWSTTFLECIYISYFFCLKN